MLSILFKLFTAFGSVPWLERFLGLAINPKLLNQLTDVVAKVTGTTDMNNAVTRIKQNREMELEVQRALLVAETAYWEQCIQDKQNARERDLAIQRLKGQNIRANIMLVMAMMGIVLSLGTLILFKPILSADGIGMLSAVAAVFGACLKDAYSFEFGTSKQSPSQMLMDFSNQMRSQNHSNNINHSNTSKDIDKKKINFCFRLIKNFHKIFSKFFKFF